MWAYTLVYEYVFIYICVDAQNYCVGYLNSFSLCVVYRVSERARSVRQWCLMTLLILLWSQMQTDLCEFNP